MEKAKTETSRGIPENFQASNSTTPCHGKNTTIKKSSAATKTKAPASQKEKTTRKEKEKGSANTQHKQSSKKDLEKARAEAAKRISSDFFTQANTLMNKSQVKETAAITQATTKPNETIPSISPIKIDLSQNVSTSTPQDLDFARTQNRPFHATLPESSPVSTKTAKNQPGHSTPPVCGSPHPTLPGGSPLSSSNVKTGSTSVHHGQFSEISKAPQETYPPEEDPAISSNIIQTSSAFVPYRQFNEQHHTPGPIAPKAKYPEYQKHPEQQQSHINCSVSHMEFLSNPNINLDTTLNFPFAMTRDVVNHQEVTNLEIMQPLRRDLFERKNLPEFSGIGSGLRSSMGIDHENEAVPDQSGNEDAESIVAESHTESICYNGCQNCLSLKRKVGQLTKELEGVRMDLEEIKKKPRTDLPPGN